MEVVFDADDDGGCLLLSLVVYVVEMSAVLLSLNLYQISYLIVRMIQMYHVTSGLISKIVRLFVVLKLGERIKNIICLECWPWAM